jgi:dihydrofolate reductase
MIKYSNYYRFSLDCAVSGKGRNEMRKIIVISFITLDGVIQGPGSPTEDTSDNFTYGGWTAPYSDDILSNTMRKQMGNPSDLLLGRITYEIFASYWPYHEELWPGIKEATKYVASSTLTKLEWNNSVLLMGNVPDEIKKLKQQDGPDLKVWGSGNFVQTLLKHDLIDEFWLKIYPITLGMGKRLFAEGTIPAAFTLYESKTSPSGVIIASLTRAGKIKTGSF